MPTLTIKLNEEQRHIPFVPGQSLRDILNMTDVRVQSGCGGRGTCGLCRVRIEKKEADEPTSSDRIYIDKTQLAKGVRLACLVRPKQDLQITILNPAPKSNWRSLPDEGGWRLKHCPTFPLKDSSKNIKNRYGVAVDLGTTHISLSLYDLSSGEWLSGRYGLNPQMAFGSDVMTRLAAVSESSVQTQTMSQKAIEAIGEALFDIATREGVDLHQVARLVLVGNTAMLALLSGRNYDLLLRPNHWMCAIDCLPDDTNAWSAGWGIHPQAAIEIIPPLAGFVGSDLLAGVVATHLIKKGKGGLFVDFGTNSEIALWDGEVLWVTSAAGGPAFEGSGISCGMPSDPGAIYRVSFKDEVPDFEVITNSKARGLCGSGLVDLIANLVRSGRLTKMGQFVPEVSKEGFVLAEGEQRIVLTKGDVDVFQRAKAAIGVGIQVLLAKVGMGHKDLRRICVGGAFGRFLNVTNAQDIGLLPRVQPDLVELCGNTALAGCKDVLLSSAVAKRLKILRNQVKIINLSQCPDFNDLFFKNLYLQSMEG